MSIENKSTGSHFVYRRKLRVLRAQSTGDFDSKPSEYVARWCRHGGWTKILLLGCLLLSSCSALRDSVTASRSFAGPQDFPPEGFAGYGIVAFPEKPNSTRGTIFCDAFIGAFLTVSELEKSGVSASAQMVTVWPIDDQEIAKTLRAVEPSCDSAIGRYGLAQALDAIADARNAEPRTIGLSRLKGRGPYLLAWSPGATKGASDTLVLISDLSAVTSAEQAKTEFRRWRDEIQQHPDLWTNGWSVEQLRITLQRWADRRSDAILSLIGTS